MATEFTMPKLGEVMEEGKVLKWKKKEGEAIAKGEILLEVETDKAVMEIESTVSGILRKILVPAGETVPVNSPLALIE
jgi:pyruvate/2-oxoglutarate dehydrogenase complex dihydrolipoamide acyltransferase (E2) component